MERIISKIDHDMNFLLLRDKDAAEIFWQKIKGREHILKQATKIINTRTGHLVFSPSVCHMILSHPSDVDKDFYAHFAANVINDKYLSKLSVADNLSFSSLIALYGINTIDSRIVGNLSNAISKKSSDNFLVKNVIYKEITDNDPKSTKFRDNLFEVLLSLKEVHVFSKKEYIEISEDINTTEIDVLMNYALNTDDLDIRLKNAIYKTYSASLEFKIDNDQEYGLDEGTPKL